MTQITQIKTQTLEMSSASICVICGKKLNALMSREKKSGMNYDLAAPCTLHLAPRILRLAGRVGFSPPWVFEARR
jgi:hypothetical protein